MINAKELRIGNKVRCTISNDAGIYQVLGMPMWGMNGEGNGKEPLILIDRCPKELVPPSKLKGIPLTAGVLSMIGFEKSEYGNREQWLGPEFIRVQKHTKARLGLMKNPLGFFAYEDAICDIKLDNLHQLQNLYFALTGEELEINL